jgi:cephalosporin hydroxylase
VKGAPVRYTIDTDQQIVHVEDGGKAEKFDLYSPEGFAALSRLWLTVGWCMKYSYQFTWLGRPIIQMPEDMVRLQEMVYQVRPDVIVETGVAHGGGQVFLASLCKLLGKGRVIGVDLEIRPHNRAALQAHELSPLITLVEGSSTDPAVVEQVRAAVRPGEMALVLLDANHSKDHVLAELEAYAPLVGVGSYVVVADGIMEDLVGVPRAAADWAWDNPKGAIAEFLARHPEFASVPPPRPFNECLADRLVTYWPEGWLRRIR